MGADTGVVDDARPLCPCHGEPCTKDGFRGGEQRWRCAVNHRAKQARYDASDEGRATSARYDASDKGRARDARYEASDKGIATRAKSEYSRRKRELQARIAAKAEKLEELRRELA